MPGWLSELAPAIVAAVIAITLHEAAHGYAARALGDPTAEAAGRISLNPLRHVDPVGTLLLPGLLLVGQLVATGRVEAMFGWAKPVPVNPWNFRHPRQGMMLVAAAGPAMNFGLAFAVALAAHGVEAWADSLAPGTIAYVLRCIGLFILANLVLGLFNLLPIPPLDGGRILVGLLPEGPAMRVASLERYGLLIVILALFVLPQIDRSLDPLGFLLRTLVADAFDLVLRLAGHPT
jgi:Zn-dependent protease